MAKAKPPPLASTIALSGAVRQLVTHALELDNPLDVPVTLSVSCDITGVHVPATIVLGAAGTSVLNVGWRPLVSGTREGALTLSSAELGSFTHRLSLAAIGAADVRSLQFKAGLGGAQVQSFRFTNFVRSTAPVVYKCALKGGVDFELEAKDVPAQPADGLNGFEVRARARCALGARSARACPPSLRTRAADAPPHRRAPPFPACPPAIVGRRRHQV